MRRAIGVALFIVLALPAAAQQQPAPMTEETLDKGLVNLGLMAGHAFQCTPEPQRADFQRMLLNFNAILLMQPELRIRAEGVSQGNKGLAASVCED